MSNKLYSITGSMLVLFAFQATQGMEEQQIPVEHQQKLTNVCVELKEIRNVKENFKSVHNNIIEGGPKYYADDKAFNELEATRGYALRRLAKNVKIKENPFIAVLAELKRQDDSEEQAPELPEDLQAFFSREFAIAQEEKAQEQAFKSLLNSLIIAENSQILSEEEQSFNAKEIIEPVTVGWGTWLKDKVWGASNLVSELESNQFSLADLKASPDEQARINNMIASYSPRNVGDLNNLINIYTQLDRLNFKFVDADVNSDIHNTCEKWRREEEVKFASFRTARVFAIMQLIKQEMQKLQQEEKPLVEMISKLEQIKKLTMKTGMVANDTEQVEVDQKNIVLSVKIFKTYCDLDALCEVLEKEEAGK